MMGDELAALWPESMYCVGVLPPGNPERCAVMALHDFAPELRDTILKMRVRHGAFVRENPPFDSGLAAFSDTMGWKLVINLLNRLERHDKMCQKC